MKITTYNSLLTGKKTWAIVFEGRPGHKGYREYQIAYHRGSWVCYKTDGYEMDNVGKFEGSKSLKSVINLIWGR